MAQHYKGATHRIMMIARMRSTTGLFLNMKKILLILIIVSGFSNALASTMSDGDKLLEIVSLFKTGPSHEAIKQLKEHETKIIEAVAKSKDGESYLLLGRAYFYAEMDSKAEKALRTALTYNDTLSDAHFFIGLINMYSGNVADAEVSFKNAIKLDGTNASYFVELGRIQEKSNKSDFAFDAYKKALDIDDLNYTANFNIANIYFGKGENEKAELHYLAALKKRPDNINLNSNLGQLYQNTNQHVKARVYFSKVVKIDPNAWRAAAKLVQVNQAIGDIPERDKAIENIYSLWREGNIDELVKQGFYIRELSTIDSGKLFVLEYFELNGEYARKYVFKIQDPVSGDIKFDISLGSYDSTTQVSRELGEIGPNDRMYHLDGYAPNGSHYTYAMFDSLPNYDDIRELVFKVLHGKRNAISGMELKGANK